jgi:hypothetical protein
VANWYVSTYLDLKLDAQLSVESASHASCTSNTKATPRLEDVICRLELLSESDRKKAFSQFGLQQVQLPSNSPNMTFFSPNPILESTETPFFPEPAYKVAEKRKFGTEELSKRSMTTWKGLEQGERVQYLLDSAEGYKCSDLSKTARPFYYTWCLPVSDCVSQCYRKDIGAFLQDHPVVRKTSKSKHACKECISRKGQGDKKRSAAEAGVV